MLKRPKGTEQDLSPLLVIYSGLALVSSRLVRQQGRQDIFFTNRQ